MSTYLSPGVYVEEIDTGPLPIESVSTSTAGFVGVTLRGPVTGPPSLVTSFADFTWQFGGYFDFGAAWAGFQYLPYAINGFFNNGGQRVYIVRVAGAGNTTAQIAAQGGVTTRLAADVSPAALTKVKLVSSRGIDTTTQLTFTQVKLGITTTAGPLGVASYDRTTDTATLAAALPGVFEARYTTVTTSVASPGASIVIQAHDPGSWGDDIDLRVAASAAKPAGSSDVIDIEGPFPSSNVRLRSTAGFYVDAWVEIDRGTTKQFSRVTAINGVVITLDPAVTAPFAAANALNPVGVAFTRVSTCEFNLTVAYGTITSQYQGLTLENVKGRFYADVVNADASALIHMVPPAAGVPVNNGPLAFPNASDGMRLVLGGGLDGAPPAAGDVMGVDNGPGNRTGIQALGDIDEISIIAAPGLADPVVQGALITQCEVRMDRFAVLDPANSPQTLSQIETQRSNFDTKYAAIYYPRIQLYDPLSGASDFKAPPSGHVVGIYARTDTTRGVFKAPANEVIQGITGLELTINKGEQDILNPSPVNINVLRDFRHTGRGFRVWGARCITSETAWKYINVRRLFIFLESSLNAGLQPLVFEPNDQKLWARVVQSVSGFLTRVWRDGALMGSKAEEAFFVHCSDTTTMTPDDILNGRLIVVIGVAPVRPAEFVIIRIGQWAGGSSVQEL